MYFWNIEALKEEIIKRQFTSRRVFPYVVLYAGLYAILIELSMYFPYGEQEINLWTYILSVLNVLIPILGTAYVYRANGGAAGKDFASKYFGIGFVVGVRFVVYFVPLIGIVIFYWYSAYADAEFYPTTLLEVTVFSVWYAALYFRIAKHIRDTVEEN